MIEVRSKFTQEFRSLAYVIKHSRSFLLFAHSNPDPDTVGSVITWHEYLTNCGKKVDISCFDAFPATLEPLFSYDFLHPDQIDVSQYDVIIACDSVERGYHKIHGLFHEKQVTVLLDHHPNLSITGDITIIDSDLSSTCELMYLYFAGQNIEITPQLSTSLLLGILSDTGNLQHPNTTPQVLEIVSLLLKNGASQRKILNVLSNNNSLSTLYIWGRALERARFNQRNGAVVTAITEDDLVECKASPEKISQIATMLTAVPNAKYSLVLSQKSKDVVRGSLRALKYANIDVSRIANQFGGGGHKLASGFEIKGRLTQASDGWVVV